MPIPKDVRPSRPESVKRTSSVDMVLGASTAGGEYNGEVACHRQCAAYATEKVKFKPRTVFATRLSFTVYVQFVYTSRTGYATPIHAIPSSMHLPLVRRSTQAARLIISSLMGSPIPVNMLVKTGGTIEQNGRYFSSSFRRGRRPRDHLCPL